MAVAGGDYVHFVVEYGGKIEKCRVTADCPTEQRAYEQKGRRLCTAHRYLCKAPSRDRTLSRSCSGRVTLTAVSW